MTMFPLPNHPKRGYASYSGLQLFNCAALVNNLSVEVILPPQGGAIERERMCHTLLGVCSCAFGNLHFVLSLLAKLAARDRNSAFE